MADADSTQKADPILVTEIVRSYVAKNSIAIDEIGPLISMVHRTLSGLGGGEPAPAPEPRAPAVPVRRSVQPDYVVCLECGFRAKTLRRQFADAARAGYRHISSALEFEARSPGDGAGLFDQPLDDGKTARARPKAIRNGNTAGADPAGTGAPGTRVTSTIPG